MSIANCANAALKLKTGQEANLRRRDSLLPSSILRVIFKTLFRATKSSFYTSSNIKHNIYLYQKIAISLRHQLESLLYSSITSNSHAPRKDSPWHLGVKLIYFVWRPSTEKLNVHIVSVSNNQLDSENWPLHSWAGVAYDLRRQSKIYVVFRTTYFSILCHTKPCNDSPQHFREAHIKNKCRTFEAYMMKTQCSKNL